MKKILSSTWTIAIVALVLGLGTQAAVLLLHVGSIGEPEHHDEKVTAEGETNPDTLAWNFHTPEAELLQAELQNRIDEAEARSVALNQFELRLQAERAEIEKLRKDLEIRRNALSTTLVEVQVLEQKNLKTLANSYSNLSPAAALAIFQEMDDEMVVKILSYMKPDPIGLILEEMARTKDGEGTLAVRAAVITDKLRLLRKVRAEEAT